MSSDLLRQANQMNAITLLLQNIDRSVANATNIITNRLLPAVRKYDAGCSSIEGQSDIIKYLIAHTPQAGSEGFGDVQGTRSTPHGVPRNIQIATDFLFEDTAHATSVLENTHPEHDDHKEEPETDIRLLDNLYSNESISEVYTEVPDPGNFVDDGNSDLLAQGNLTREVPVPGNDISRAQSFNDSEDDPVQLASNISWSF